MSEADRAALLAQTVRLSLRQPKSAERNDRIDRLIAQLDDMSPAILELKLGAHISMNGYYRADDIDAGIVRHSTWLINTGKTLTPDLRRKYGNAILEAYINMAEAVAGQGKPADALALLRRAATEWPDLPNVASRVDPVRERYRLVGTPAAAITAPRFLNAPDD